MESNLQDYDKTELGKIQIAPEVLEIIAGIAASEVEGVNHLSGSLVGDIAERFGRKNPGKGVRVEVGQKEAALDISVIISFGYRIPEVARNIQENVRNAIESMTGLTVVEVNVHVVDVQLKPEPKRTTTKDEMELEESPRVR